MISFHIKKHCFILTLLVLLIELQVSACSTENSINTATNNSEQNRQTINETSTDNITMSGGMSNGAVIEDDVSNDNNLLEVSGKLNLTNLGTNNKNFIANTINGTYGSLTISTAGNWSYTADNTQAVIQNLATGTSLTENLFVNSTDGTTHIIIITIFGVDENTVTSNSITLSWIAPVTHEDNSPLPLSAIAGYKIYYGTTQGQYPNSASINDASVTGYAFNNLSANTYYFVVTTIDIDGRESRYSTEIAISL